MLEEQIKRFSENEKVLLQQLLRQSEQIEKLVASVASLEKALLEKNGYIESLAGKNKGLSKLLSNKSEKMKNRKPAAPENENDETPQSETSEDKNCKKKSPKERGNNNARRKEFFGLEEVLEEVYPEDAGFCREKSRTVSYTDSITYKFIPPKFIKHICRQYNCLQDGKMYSGKSLKTALLNSNYDTSFMAGMLQLRYIYSMPVERIVKYFTEHGFEMNKATAHGLIKKSAWTMNRLNEVLGKTIETDDYLCMDESYYTVLTKETGEQGKGVRKGYIWAALANGKKLVQYFYKKGSRKKEVLTDYISTDYKGAIQTDGLSNYKVLEADIYPDVIRLACFQHCKRKFLDIEGDKDAGQIVDMINSLYQNEHKMQDDWKPERKIRYRKKYAPPILKRLKEKLTEIKSDPATLPKSPLSIATNYMLTEFDALSNYILRHDYALDNNAIERCMRYISLSRKNSLFCGSHDGAERTALIYSLACSCRLNNINTFEYFTDILNRIPFLSPKTPDEVYRDLLPDRWKKQ